MSVPFLSPAARTQLLTPAVTTVLFLVLLSGLLTLLVGAFPISLGESQWRFNMTVQFFSAAPQIAILLMLIMVTATHGAEYRVTRAAALLAMIFGALYILAMPFFALDFLAARHLQPQDGIGRFMRDGARLVAATGLLALALLWSGWRAYQVSNTTKDVRRAKGDGLIVAQQEQPL